jgi:hypothetical protein
MTRTLLLTLLVLAAEPALAQHRVAPTMVAANGSTRVAATLSGVPVSADIATFAPAPSARVDRRGACTGSRIPCALIAQLRLHAGRAAIDVPRAVVARLADVNRASLRLRGRGRYELVLECGDASEAYAAHVMFDARRVTQMDIVDNEAGMLAERTIYSDLSHAFDH